MARDPRYDSAFSRDDTKLCFRARKCEAVMVSQRPFGHCRSVVTRNDARRCAQRAKTCGFEIGDIEPCCDSCSIGRKAQHDGHARRRVEHRGEEAALHGSVAVGELLLRDEVQCYLAVFGINGYDFAAEQLRRRRALILFQPTIS